MNVTRSFDPIEAESALEDLAGVAALLADASSAHDVSQRGVQVAANLLEDIHVRLARALGFKEDAR